MMATAGKVSMLKGYVRAAVEEANKAKDAGDIGDSIFWSGVADKCRKELKAARNELRALESETVEND